MKRKSDIAKDLFISGNVKEALRMAKTFRIGLSKEDTDKIVRAYECMIHSDFYKMLGKNPESEIQKGIEVFEQKILKGA